MKNVSGVASKVLCSGLSLLLLLGSVVVPTTSFADACGTAENVCGDTTNALKKMIDDPKCKADSSCLDCVNKNLGQGQMANYCSAYSSTKKSNKSQNIQTATYTVTALLCGTSCVLQQSVYPATVAVGQALGKACGGLALATAGLEIIMAISSNNLSGAAMGVVTGAATAGKNYAVMTASKVAGQAAAKAAVNAATKGGSKLTAMSKTPACGTFAIYGLLAGAKLLSGKSMKKAKEAQCQVVDGLGKSANSVAQSCQLGKELPPLPPSTGSAGMFAATAESFAGVKVEDGVKTLGVTAADQFIKDIKGDLAKEEANGRFNVGDIAKQIDDGADLGSLLSGVGSPELVSAIVEGDRMQQNGEKFKQLAGLDGGYSAPGAGGTNVASAGTGSSGTSEMGFGNMSGAAPGEGVESATIERAPAASVASALSSDGDILHSAFAGSIFDIISIRIKEQKGQYAEAEPEGRLNRAFNGFKDRDRLPAARSGK